MITDRIKPGDTIWVVERDEYGEPDDFSSCMFLARVKNAVIASYFIDLKTIDDTINYLVEDTRDDYSTRLCVFYNDDCYEK